MTRFGSSLNPYAAPYIPLNIREANRTFMTDNSSIYSVGEPSLHNPLPNREANRSLTTDNSSVNSFGELYFHNPPFMGQGENAPVAVASAVNIHPFHGSVSQRSNTLTEAEMLDRQFNLDMEFLLANFFDLSNEFLTEVYLANECNLEAAVRTLNQLKSNYPYDYGCGNLPDSLGIGDT